MGIYDNQTLFSLGQGVLVPNFTYRLELQGVELAQALVDNTPWAADATAVTPALDFIGGRPCINLTNSGSTATDGAQFQLTAGHIQPQAGKKIRIKWGMRMSTTDQDWSFGLAAVDTSVIASEPTDHFGVQKLAAVTQPKIRARKASGTAQTSNDLAITFAADVWHDFELILTRDSTTAGQGEVLLYGKANANPNEIGTVLYQGTFATQIPDTVDLAPYMAWRAGSAANVSGYISHFGVLVER